MMSPAARASPPPLSSTLSSPSRICQPSFGKALSRALRQPQLVRPSQSSSKPCERSSSVSVFGAMPVAARGSSRIRIFRHFTVRPASFASWTWKPMKPERVTPSVMSAIAVPFTHVRSRSPLASTR